MFYNKMDFSEYQIALIEKQNTDLNPEKFIKH